MQREKNLWNVTLQAESGAIVETTIEAYWDPNKISPDLVGAAAAAEAFMAHDKQMRFAPIATTFIA